MLENTEVAFLIAGGAAAGEEERLRFVWDAKAVVILVAAGPLLLHMALVDQ